MTNAERCRRGISDMATCPCCDAADETVDHLFRQCDMAMACWFIAAAPNNFMFTNYLPLTNWIKRACSNDNKAVAGISWNLLFPYLLWNLWLARNQISFNGVRSPAPEILQRAIKGAKEAQTLLLKHNGPDKASQLWVAWTPPPAGYVKVNTDGAKKANTGLASAGGLIRDDIGQWVVGFLSNIGNTNSFIAELWGFREGLIIAKSHGFDKVVAETDSEALKHVMEAGGEQSMATNTLISDCRALMRDFRSIKITHILREGNQSADFLANLGQNSDWGTTILDDPPEGLRQLLVRDSHGVAASRRR